MICQVRTKTLRPEKQQQHSRGDVFGLLSILLKRKWLVSCSFPASCINFYFLIIVIWECNSNCTTHIPIILAPQSCNIFMYLSMFFLQLYMYMSLLQNLKLWLNRSHGLLNLVVFLDIEKAFISRFPLLLLYRGWYMYLL